MASEIRVNTINSRTGLGTITVSETGQDFAGISTFSGEVHITTQALMPKAGFNVTAGVSTFQADISMFDKIVHTGDLNTAIRFPSNDTFSVETSGSERLRIDSSGSLLLGQTASYNVFATSKLQVSSTDSAAAASITRWSANAFGPYLNFGKSRGGSAGSYTIVQDDDVLGTINFAVGDGVDLESTGGKITCEVDGTPGANDTPGRIAFWTTADGGYQPTEALRITSGNAVNFYSPDGNSKGYIYQTNSDNFIVEADANDNIDGDLLLRAVADGGTIQMVCGGNNERLRITSVGNLGLGSNTSPVATAANYDGASLHIHQTNSSSAGSQIHLTNGATGAAAANGAMVSMWSDDDLYITNQESDGMIKFSSGGNTDVLVIDDSSNIRLCPSAGQIYVGKTSGDCLIDIDSSHYVITSSGKATTGINIDGTSGNADEYGGGISFQCGATGAAAIAALQGAADADQVGLAFFTHNSNTGSDDSIEIMRIQSNGDLFIGTKTIPSGSQRGVTIAGVPSGNPIWFRTSSSHYTGGGYTHWTIYDDHGQVGWVNADGDGTASYNSASDYRLKENVVAITDGIAKVKQLKPYRFNFKTADASQVVQGFFAHEVSSVVPNAVNGDKDGVAAEDNNDTGHKKGDPIYQGLDTAKMVPILTAALKEAIDKIETLETKVATLESA